MSAMIIPLSLGYQCTKKNIMTFILDLVLTVLFGIDSIFGFAFQNILQLFWCYLTILILGP